MQWGFEIVFQNLVYLQAVFRNFDRSAMMTKMFMDAVKISTALIASSSFHREQKYKLLSVVFRGPRLKAQLRGIEKKRLTAKIKDTGKASTEIMGKVMSGLNCTTHV